MRKQLLNLKSVYFSVIQKPLNNEEEVYLYSYDYLQKQACIAELVNLINNPLLQISAISETVFESLPFEIQLKYMCLSKCSDLYYDIHNLNDSLQYAMKVNLMISVLDIGIGIIRSDSRTMETCI